MAAEVNRKDTRCKQAQLASVEVPNTLGFKWSVRKIIVG